MVTIEDLVGCWVTDPRDVAARDRFGDVQLEFHPDGRLDYRLRGSESDRSMFLTFRIESGELVTDQPSDPREHRTPVRIDDAGRLIVGEGAGAVTYLRR